MERVRRTARPTGDILQVVVAATRTLTLTLRDDVQAPLVQRDESMNPDGLVASVQNTIPAERVVITVMGEPGAGKATLVREVYERPKTKTIFGERVWASFPPYLGVSSILQLIYQQLEDTSNKFCGEDIVHTKVEEKLKEKKFLLVIDGEVSNTDWVFLLSRLPDNKKGCRIVRIMQGSSHPLVYPWVFVPNLFSKKETTDLLSKWVPKQEEGNPGDKTIAKTMDARLYDMTEGLPLAVVLLCGLLKTKEYPKEWDKVFKHLEGNQSNQSKRVDMVLTMCFDDLPHDLKSCFLYFAAWPMNGPIETHKLVCMWMAEGFLRPEDGKTMEKLGRIYLKDLVFRNLVKVVKKDSFSGEQFVAVHRKVHEFLRHEAQEANFVEVHSGHDTPSLTSARRLSLQNYTDKYAALAHPLPKLRSILSSFQEGKELASIVEKKEGKEQASEHNKQKGEVEGVMTGVELNGNAKDEVAPHGISCSGMLRRCGGQKGRTNRDKHIRGMLQQSRFLRVINLQGVEIGKKLPETIRNVPHLQYLGVTACSLESIPSVIGELKELQTLDVRDTQVKELPASFWKIKTLRHVFGSGLILPKRVGNLKYLQTLETIQPDKEHGWDAKTFQGMVHLQSLCLFDSSSGRKNDDDVEALYRVIKDPKFLQYLDKLVINVGTIPGVVFTSESQRRLRAMALCGQLKLEEEYKFSVLSLTFLSLKRTKVSAEFIRKLGELPLLANLILDEESCSDGQLVFVAGEFKSLKRLTISHLNILKHLKIDKHALPELTDLVITSYNTEITIEVPDRELEFVKKVRAGDDRLASRIQQSVFQEEMASSSIKEHVAGKAAKDHK